MPRRRVNRLLVADERLGDDELFAEQQEELSRVAEAAHEDNDEEVEQSTVMDEEDMFDAESELRQAASRAETARIRGGDKSGKGKTLKGADKVHDKDDEWRSANTLEAPPPRSGMVQRWIRYALGNENDPRNWTRAMREGWVVRSIDTIPDGYDAPTIKHSTAGTVIAIGDLILCEMRIERFKSRRKFFREKLARQLMAIERKPLNEAERLGGPGIKTLNRKNVSWGRGRRTARATDEE